MKKKLKLGIIYLISFMMFSATVLAADTTASKTKDKAADVVEAKEKTTPLVKVDSKAPTVKAVAEKEEAKAAVMKKLAEEPVAGPFDEFNRSTPRASLVALAIAIKEKDFERAVNYLDLRNLPFTVEKELDGEALVRKLVIVAKRAMNIDIEDMSNDPKGHKDDGLPGYRDRITTLKTKNGPVDILMQRIPRGDGVSIWKISNATVALIPVLDEEFGYGVIGNKLSQIFPHYTVFGFEIWQLVMLVGLLIAAVIVAYVTTFIVIKILQRNERFDQKRLQKFIIGPLRFLIMVIMFRSTFHMVAPSLTAQAVFEARTFLIIAVYWILLGLVDLIMLRLADRMRRNGQQDAAVLLKPAATGIKLTITLIAVITWMDNLGYEVTTILAGLGVGGIAIALAAQKSLENLIGSITIYASQPVHVGDFCKFGTTLGTVEEIGLRSTQIRTVARTIVHIPNAMFASGEIENLTQRDKILYRTRLRLSYEDTPDQVKQVLAKIRELIEQHEFIDEADSRVRFLEFGEYAQELELYVFIKTKIFSEYLEHREDINLKINEIVEAVGVKLVIPARTSYIKELPEPVAS
jgi:MscS family membrane protein